MTNKLWLHLFCGFLNTSEIRSHLEAEVSYWPSRWRLSQDGRGGERIPTVGRDVFLGLPWLSQ